MPATVVPGQISPSQPADESALEDQATQLLAALPLSERRDILLPHQLHDRQRRERELTPVLAVKDAGPDPVMRAWEHRDELLTRADLAPNERAVLLLHAHHGMSDREIADLFGQRRATITERRLAAVRKVRAALAQAD